MNKKNGKTGLKEQKEEEREREMSKTMMGAFGGEINQLKAKAIRWQH